MTLCMTLSLVTYFLCSNSEGYGGTAQCTDAIGSPEPSMFIYVINVLFSSADSNMSLVMRKPGFGVCDQVRHKPACAATEAR